MALAITGGTPSDKVAKRLNKALADATGQDRHDDTRDNVLALLRYGKNGEPGVKAALIAVQAAFVKAVTADGTRTEPRRSKNSSGISPTSAPRNCSASSPIRTRSSRSSSPEV